MHAAELVQGQVGELVEADLVHHACVLLVEVVDVPSVAVGLLSFSTTTRPSRSRDPAMYTLSHLSIV